MFRKKIYGQSKTEECPFCGKIPTTSNEQKIPTCQDHKDVLLEDLKCACNDWLDLKESKYGPFFVCMNCGPVSFKKALDLNGYPLKSILDL
ncbi:hypothetical protein K9L67_03550 [Candidatus Woesearchaeota archaeon]|nr:hypothetical protein [Candidatus Woesearchaeota archaeon]MCF7901276.1 hypothetical protein [Candidatus Woesearchaeota archaeon]MCF8013557.1 hypothetical protein [Candidatus Woesearchaeota archaeon]